MARAHRRFQTRYYRYNSLHRFPGISLVQKQFRPGCARKANVKKRGSTKTIKRNMNRTESANRKSRRGMRPGIALVFIAAFLTLSLRVFAVPPPTGVAPVNVPAGGFGIDG